MNMKVIGIIVVVIAALIGFRVFVSTDSTEVVVDSGDASPSSSSQNTPASSNPQATPPQAVTAEQAHANAPVGQMKPEPSSKPESMPVSDVDAHAALQEHMKPVDAETQKAIDAIHQIDDITKRELTPEERAAIESITADLGQNPQIDPSIDHRFTPASGEGPIETPYTGPAPEDSMPQEQGDVTPPGM